MPGSDAGMVDRKDSGEQQTPSSGGGGSAAMQTVPVIRDSQTRPAYKLSVQLIDTYKYINKVCSRDAVHLCIDG